MRDRILDFYCAAFFFLFATTLGALVQARWQEQVASLSDAVVS